MASMTGKGQSRDLLLRVTLSVPLAYAAFEAAYRLLHRGLGDLLLGVNGAGFDSVDALLVAAVVLFAVGSGLLLSHRGRRATWSIVLACSLAFSAIWLAFLISIWSLRRGTQPRF